MKQPKKVLIQCGIGVMAIALNLIVPEFIDAARYWVLGLVILLVGMPHGAIDHIIDGTIEDWNPYTFNSKFYGWYLGAVVFYSVFWIFFPVFSFAFFLLITLYHFGQADAERFEWDKISTYVLQFSRGFTVVGLLVFGDLAYASAVMESVTGFSAEAYFSGFLDITITKWIIAGIYPLFYLLLSAYHKPAVTPFFIYLGDSLIVSLLFILCDPVWAFSIYFGLWHSYNHIHVMLSFLSRGDKKLSISWFYKNSFIFSLLSYLGILFVYNILEAFGNEQLMISLLLVVIAVLTLPHMFVVEKLYTEKNK